MEASVVAVTLSEGLERAESADDMLDANATTGKGGVEGAVFRGSGARARLAARRGASRMEGFDPNIGQIAQNADLGAEAFWQPGRAQEFEIVGRATDARRDIHDPAALINGHLHLEGVLLLLAAVV